MLFLAKVVAFLNPENTYNHFVRPNINRDPPKINFESLKSRLPYSFEINARNLVVIFHGVKQKFWADIFLIEYWILKIASGHLSFFGNQQF